MSQLLEIRTNDGFDRHADCSHQLDPDSGRLTVVETDSRKVRALYERGFWHSVKITYVEAVVGGSDQARAQAAA